MVADGNHTNGDKDDVYSGVIGFKTVHLDFQLAAMSTFLFALLTSEPRFYIGILRKKCMSLMVQSSVNTKRSY